MYLTKLHNLLRLTLSTGLLVGSIQMLYAQKLLDSTSSLTSLERAKLSSLWLKTDNAAALPLYGLRDFSTIQAEYSTTNGKFKNPQHGKKENSLAVFSEEYLKLSKAYVFGSFEYNDRTVHDAGFNASILDTERGMPYYIADTFKSDWRKHNYNLHFKAATLPIDNKVILGISGSYSAADGAKQRDPRTDNRQMTFSISPAIIYIPAPGHRVGLNIGYGTLKEQSSMQNVNVYDDHDYYMLYGLGKSVKHIGSGATTDYKGIDLSSVLQYHFAGNSTEVLVDLGYRRHTETATTSFSTPNNRGSILLNNLYGSVTFIRETRTLIHSLRLFGSTTRNHGIEYVNIRDTSVEQKGWITLHKSIRSAYNNDEVGGIYTLMSKKGSGYGWRLDLSGKYESTDNEYYIPHSTFNVCNLITSVRISKDLTIDRSGRHSLLFRLGYTNGNNLSGKYTYAGSHPDSPIVIGLELDKFRHSSATFNAIEGSMTYSTSIGSSSTSTLFATLGYDGSLAKYYDLGSRSRLTFTVGYNF